MHRLLSRSTSTWRLPTITTLQISRMAWDSRRVTARCNYAPYLQPRGISVSYSSSWGLIDTPPQVALQNIINDITMSKTCTNDDCAKMARLLNHPYTQLSLNKFITVTICLRYNNDRMSPEKIAVISALCSHFDSIGTMSVSQLYLCAFPLVYLNTRTPELRKYMALLTLKANEILELGATDDQMGYKQVGGLLSSLRNMKVVHGHEVPLWIEAVYNIIDRNYDKNKSFDSLALGNGIIGLENLDTTHPAVKRLFRLVASLVAHTPSGVKYEEDDIALAIRVLSSINVDVAEVKELVVALTVELGKLRRIDGKSVFRIVSAIRSKHNKSAEVANLFRVMTRIYDATPNDSLLLKHLRFMLHTIRKVDSYSSEMLAFISVLTKKVNTIVPSLLKQSNLSEALPLRAEEPPEIKLLRQALSGERKALAKEMRNQDTLLFERSFPPRFNQKQAFDSTTEMGRWLKAVANLCHPPEGPKIPETLIALSVRLVRLRACGSTIPANFVGNAMSGIMGISDEIVELRHFLSVLVQTFHDIPGPLPAQEICAAIGDMASLSVNSKEVVSLVAAFRHFVQRLDAINGNELAAALSGMSRMDISEPEVESLVQELLSKAILSEEKLSAYSIANIACELQGRSLVACRFIEDKLLPDLRLYSDRIMTSGSEADAPELLHLIQRLSLLRSESESETHSNGPNIAALTESLQATLDTIVDHEGFRDLVTSAMKVRQKFAPKFAFLLNKSLCHDKNINISPNEIVSGFQCDIILRLYEYNDKEFISPNLIVNFEIGDRIDETHRFCTLRDNYLLQKFGILVVRLKSSVIESLEADSLASILRPLLRDRISEVAGTLRAKSVNIEHAANVLSELLNPRPVTMRKKKYRFKHSSPSATNIKKRYLKKDETNK